MSKLTLKELSKKQDLLTGGHRLCAGCGAPIVVRQILLAAEDPVIVTSATGCLEVATTIYPFTAWRVPFFHSAFENSAATATGIEAMYQSLKKQGKMVTIANKLLLPTHLKVSTKKSFNLQDIIVTKI